VERDPKDHKHALLVKEYIAAMVKKGFSLVDTEVLHTYGKTRGYIDAVLVSRQRHSQTGKYTLIAAECKPRFFDIGNGVREVKTAKLYFEQSAPTSKLLGNTTEYSIAYPMIVQATEENMLMYLKNINYFQSIALVFFDKDPKVCVEFRNSLNETYVKQNNRDVQKYFRETFFRSVTPVKLFKRP